MICSSRRRPRPMPSQSLRHSSSPQSSSVSSVFNVCLFRFLGPMLDLFRVNADPARPCAVPIIIPNEFCARYIDFCNGKPGALTIAGQLVAMLLVVWAASFGVDEYGVDESQSGSPMDTRDRKSLTNDMVRELLVLFDIHGVMRKPSWDGVRALLLLLPLTEGMFSSLFSPAPIAPRTNSVPLGRRCAKFD